MRDKRRALVLGGGGPVGVGWQTGLAAGLSASGVDLSLADKVVGTSAGSITGAYITGGADATQLVDEIADLFAKNIEGSGVDQVPVGALDPLMEDVIAAMASGDEQVRQARLAQVGRAALDAQTISEDAFVGTLHGALGNQEWPAGFACTAVNAETGEFVVWDEGAGVPLERAVASSCAVPGVYPPVTINGARYMDGGVRSPLNSDLAAGHDAAIVVSVMPLELPAELMAEFGNATIQQFFDAQLDEIERLGSTGTKVEVIAPDQEFLDLSGYGLSLMDFNLLTPAVEAGIRLGKAEAERIRAIW